LANRDIVVIGGSAGSMEVLRMIAAELPPGLPAAVLVVVHMGSLPNRLPSLLSGYGRLPATFAQDGQLIEQGRLYVAPPDRHLLVQGQQMILRRGPRENMSRPAIDPLFRSAAVSHGGRAIGVVLSGSLNDGAAGLAALKRCGGLAVVQDPAGADEPSMPRAAIDAVEVDHVVPADRIGGVLVRLVNSPAGATTPPPEDIRREAEIAARGVDAPWEIAAASDPLSGPVFSCPDCGGPLSEVGDNVARFRCAVGHAHTADTLLEAQALEVETALWAALRTNRERAALLKRMASEARGRKHEASASLWAERAAEYERHARAIQNLLMDTRRERQPA
jgi:two-component system chemotaxis response regulator CheB